MLSCSEISLSSADMSLLRVENLGDAYNTDKALVVVSVSSAAKVRRDSVSSTAAISRRFTVVSWSEASRRSRAHVNIFLSPSIATNDEVVDDPTNDPRMQEQYEQCDNSENNVRRV